MDEHIKTFQERQAEGQPLVEAILHELADYKCRCADLKAQLAFWKNEYRAVYTLLEQVEEE
jgi:hypothetical protein